MFHCGPPHYRHNVVKESMALASEFCSTKTGIGDVLDDLKGYVRSNAGDLQYLLTSALTEMRRRSIQPAKATLQREYGPGLTLTTPLLSDRPSFEEGNFSYCEDIGTSMKLKAGYPKDVVLCFVHIDLRKINVEVNSREGQALIRSINAYCTRYYHDPRTVHGIVACLSTGKYEYWDLQKATHERVMGAKEKFPFLKLDEHEKWQRFDVGHFWHWVQKDYLNYFNRNNGLNSFTARPMRCHLSFSVKNGQSVDYLHQLAIFYV